ncbi:heavy metal translocating P-type ATPase [Bengtsoniella intestinalis]|uniref:heavy metal translocating P-type ATPase n=1 Tax=Bengtsoniella intestinalis TaxID=3073143 RepID=UPI00391F405D
MPTPMPTQVTTTLFTLENLGCAHCAAKMEERIRTINGVDDASITFATKQLRVTAPNAVALLPELQAICTAIEPDVKVVPPAKEKVTAPAKVDHKKPLVFIGLGAVLFAIALLLGHFMPQVTSLLPTALFAVAYIILGWRVLRNAVKNVLRGQMLDENFLMSIATIGAIVLGEYSEAVGVMLFYRIGEYCEEQAVNRSRAQITEAVDLRPDVVSVVSSNGQTVELPAEDVTVGQSIQVRVGDRIPLDGVILTGESRLDTAAITGEPVPVSVTVGDAIHSGCINLSGVLTMRVTHVLDESMVSRILRAVEDAAASKPKIERVLTKFAHVYTPTVVAIAVLTALIPSFITGNWSHWVHTALTFLVISCPCALVLSVPLAFFSGIGAGSKKGILFKSGASLEALHDIKCVAMDKTGTLTLGNFVVQDITAETGMDADTLLSITASAEAHSTHPIAVSIVTAAKEKGLSLVAPTALEEKAGMGIVATFEGKTVLCGNEKLMADQAITMPTQQTAIGSVVYVAVNGAYAGSIRVADTIKPEATATISALKNRGLTTAMMTGDNLQTAELTAQTLGLDDVRGNLLPTDKVDGLLELREKHGAILYIGDGINDAPVLAGADVGGAMGSGADAAIEVADVVFMTSDLSTVDNAIDIANKTHTIVRVNIFFALFVKILVMVLGITGIYSSMWLAIFADVGVALLCVLNAVQVLYRKQ